MTYTKLNIIPFGEHLLKSGDLDPLYIALVKANLERDYLKRWLLVYWTFYSAGVASFIADAPTTDLFWERWRVAAVNEEPTPFGMRWARGHERRHMRGEAALACWKELSGRYRDNPEGFVDHCVPLRSFMDKNNPDKPVTCGEVMTRVKGHAQFGPWIGFKVADMAERVLGIKVDFTAAEVFIFKDPRKAALLLWRLSQGLPEGAKPRDEARVLELAVHYLTTAFSDHLAPPLYDRPVGLQEVETVLCKWKSHLNNHYPLNNDIRDIRNGLHPWRNHSETARQLWVTMPEEME